ncbi:MAG: hypothetical protein AUG49_22495 [Catenulispora sp. 13_1_20CM_3_70_7]|nr:MAG: hypothetical protein AUG49_22495 [Catenulispora sp. 13_1_20CM_3_70_7]
MAIALAAALALSAGPSPAMAGSGTVSGTLIDDDTGGVAGGMAVSACGSSGCVTGSGRSDLSGHYSLTLPAASGWNVLTGDCSPGGYALSHKYGVNVVDGGSVAVDLHLTRRSAVIGGRVLDQGGTPVPDVGLLIDNAETGGFGMALTTSAADGTYSAGCLAAGGVAGAGTYYITAVPSAISAYGGQQDAGIAVHPGATIHHDVRLQKAGGGIQGHVTCGAGPCPSGISVLVYCEGCLSSANTSTDSAGTYETGHLLAGHKFDVHVVAPAGWDNAIHYGVAVGEGGKTAVDFVLLPSGPTKSGRLTGHVSDAAGALHGQCLINAFGGVRGTSAGGWTDGDVHSGDDGAFDTGFQLVPGDYLVFLVCPGWPQVSLNGGHAIAVGAGPPARPRSQPRRSRTRRSVSATRVRRNSWRSRMSWAGRSR